MNFRKDINGLRAIAVMAVVLYHFNASWMPGGFAGVDVFFVISGFLMTGLIFRGIEQENFSILRFYVARANRIIPALAVLCLVLLVLGWFYLSPLDYKALAKHVVSSLSFLSNIIYWRESGYFDAASHEKWLLHTWSLSVEWQFYIIYPLVLVAMRKVLSVKVMKVVVLLGTILGFIFCVIATYKWPNAAYYLLPTRAWEMMIGGVAYLYPIYLKESRKKLLEWFGLLLIIGSYLLISKDSPWPGYLSLFPVLGTFLIIQAQRNESFITNNIVSQRIGDWSYSIYLWHWPLVVAIYYFALSDGFIYLGIVMSVILGFLSHKYIEKIKFRNDFSGLISYFKCRPLYMLLIVGSIGSMTFITKGFQFHYDEDVVVAAYGALDINTRRGECLAGYGEESRQCEYGKGSVDAIVLGDSHAQSFLPLITGLVTNKTLDFTLSSCRTIEGIYIFKDGFRYDNCGLWLSTAINKIPKDIPIIIHNWLNIIFDNEHPHEFIKEAAEKDIGIYRDLMAAQYIKTICKIADNNPVIIIKDTPVFNENIPAEMARQLMFDSSEYRVSISVTEYRKQNVITNEIYSRVEMLCNGVTLIDPEPILCGQEYCYGDSEGKPLYFDSNHLSNEGVELFDQSIRAVLLPMLNKSIK